MLGQCILWDQPFLGLGMEILRCRDGLHQSAGRVEHKEVQRALAAHSSVHHRTSFPLQASSEKIWRAGKLLFTYLTSTSPSLIRDHKHHLRHHRWGLQHPPHLWGPSEGSWVPQPHSGGFPHASLSLQEVLLREGAGGLDAECRAGHPDAKPSHRRGAGAGGRRGPDAR